MSLAEAVEARSGQPVQGLRGVLQRAKVANKRAVTGGSVIGRVMRDNVCAERGRLPACLRRHGDSLRRSAAGLPTAALMAGVWSCVALVWSPFIWCTTQACVARIGAQERRGTDASTERTVGR
jgi:hypothetical protein